VAAFVAVEVAVAQMKAPASRRRRPRLSTMAASDACPVQPIAADDSCGSLAVARRVEQQVGEAVEQLMVVGLAVEVLEDGSVATEADAARGRSGVGQEAPSNSRSLPMRMPY
jgi:hypothetical protein